MVRGRFLSERGNIEGPKRKLFSYYGGGELREFFWLLELVLGRGERVKKPTQYIVERS